MSEIAAALPMHPEYLKQLGVPDGFCGICERCGYSGHTRHFPGQMDDFPARDCSTHLLLFGSR